MITKLTLEERVREWALRDSVVEKDYVLGWLLWGIGSDKNLADTWTFKGGTCLKKCYIETYRFSEDLDFTILPGGPITPDQLDPILNALLARVAEESGIDFSIERFRLKSDPSGNYTEGRIYYRGPRGARQPSRVKLDLIASEKVVRPTVPRPIAHAYPDYLPEPSTVRCYCFEELFAEKIRAMGERGRPRDLYDIINLFRRPDLNARARDIQAILVEKCESKGVPVPTFESIAGAGIYEELASEWGNMLEHQLPALPPFEDFWKELPDLFAWLEEILHVPLLTPAPAFRGELGAEEWAPPATVRTWNLGVPLETIRFAASNHLCIRLGYKGTTRIIEPYSLRQTRAGNLVLHAIRVDRREHRSYRVDRIESVEATTQSFTPVYRVEFSSGSMMI